MILSLVAVKESLAERIRAKQLDAAVSKTGDVIDKMASMVIEASTPEAQKASVEQVFRDTCKPELRLQVQSMLDEGKSGPFSDPTLEAFHEAILSLGERWLTQLN